MGILSGASQPAPEPEPEQAEQDEDLGERLAHFAELGFDDLTAWALAWSDASWSECRERWLKRGASHEETARYFLT